MNSPKSFSRSALLTFGGRCGRCSRQKSWYGLVKAFLDTRGAEAGPDGAGLLGAFLLDAPHHGRTQLWSGAEGAGAAGIALVSGGGVDAGTTISSSTTEWRMDEGGVAELDGGPGGSVDGGPLPLPRDAGHR